MLGISCSGVSAHRRLSIVFAPAVDPRNRLDKALATGTTFASAEEVLKYIYKTK